MGLSDLAVKRVAYYLSYRMQVWTFGLQCLNLKALTVVFLKGVFWVRYFFFHIIMT